MKPKLLIVDDDLDILKMLHNSFAGDEMDVVLETDSATALQRIVSDRPNVAIFDINMPRMNGLEFLNAVDWNFGLGGWNIGTEKTVFSSRSRHGTPFRFANMICFESVYPALTRVDADAPLRGRAIRAGWPVTQALHAGMKAGMAGWKAHSTWSELSSLPCRRSRRHWRAVRTPRQI